MKSINYIFCLALILIISSCSKAPQYPIEPKIAFVSYSKDVLVQSLVASTDSLKVKISFTDGDGDLSLEDNGLNIFITDTRDGNVLPGNSFPAIPTEGTGNGISGEMDITINSTCCIFSDGTICHPSTTEPENELVYSIYIKDRAGHESNVLTLPAIRLLCE